MSDHYPLAKGAEIKFVLPGLDDTVINLSFLSVLVCP